MAEESSASGIPDGILQVQVEEEGGPALAIEAVGGRLTTIAGIQPEYRCLMWFKDLKSLSQILSGEMDAYTVFAQNRAGIRGYVPMADKLNPILRLLPGYLE